MSVRSGITTWESHHRGGGSGSLSGGFGGPHDTGEVRSGTVRSGCLMNQGDYPFSGVLNYEMSSSDWPDTSYVLKRSFAACAAIPRFDGMDRPRPNSTAFSAEVLRLMAASGLLPGRHGSSFPSPAE